jgi:hypothetical protein
MMMNVQDVLEAIDSFSEEQLRQVREHLRQIDDQHQTLDPEQLSPEEWMLRLRAAADAIREGLTEEEWADIERAMNKGSYISS